VQIAVNDDPTDANEADCESFYYPMQNANFNVIGLSDANGTLVERYEYTPYGQRTVYKKAGSKDALTTAPLVHSQRVETDSGRAPYGLCDVGHQGLMHDEQFGLVYNRNRYLDPRTGRWSQRDPAGYVDGMSLYQYATLSPVATRDPSGMQDATQPATKPEAAQECYCCCAQDVTAVKLAQWPPPLKGWEDDTRGRMGHRFRVTFHYEYVKDTKKHSEEARHCKMRWMEISNLVPDRFMERRGELGEKAAKPHGWYDAKELADLMIRGDPFWRGWDRRDTTPGKHTASITDNPSVWIGPNRYAFFRLIIESAEDCPCKWDAVFKQVETRCDTIGNKLHLSWKAFDTEYYLSLIHISEPTRPY